MAMKQKSTQLQTVTDEELEEELSRRKRERLSGKLFKVERQLEEEAAKLATKTLQDFFDEKTENQPRRSNCPKCGKSVGIRASNRRREVTTTAGTATLSRHYYYCRSCEDGFYPLDQELGLTEGSELSPGMEARILDFGMEEPYEAAARRWKRHHLGYISEWTVRQVVERAGDKLQQQSATQRAKKMTSSKRSDEQDVLVISTDGSMIHTRDEDWKEAKLAVLYRTQDGYKIPRRKSCYVATMSGIEGFTKELEPFVKAARKQPSKAVVWLGDGAPWNWNLASELAPKAIQVLDWVHAVEHGAKVANLIFGQDEAMAALYLNRIKDLLEQGAIDILRRELLDCQVHLAGQALVEMSALRNYYLTNQKRMQYKRFRELGIPIGSGAVESAHRHVLQRRMKLAGQHWSLSSAQKLVMLRAAYKSANDNDFLSLVGLAA